LGDSSAPPSTSAAVFIVRNWYQRCQAITNGSSNPSAAFQAALVTFCSELDISGLLPKMLCINPFCPSDFTAATVPLFTVGTLAQWTPHNFSGGDLTVNGIIGNGSNAYMETGITGQFSLSDTNAGLSVYCYTPATVNGVDMGYFNNAGSINFFWTANLVASGKSRGDIWNGTVDTVQINSLGSGYYSANRISSTDLSLYYAKVGTAHSRVAQTVTAVSSQRAGQFINVFAGNAYESFNPSYAPTNARYSFVSFHKGLTQSESLVLYNAVFKLRTAFGGGYV
jgi:hypothetical protein